MSRRVRDNLWQQLDTEKYRQQSQKSRDNVLALIDAGRDKKLDAAREAYAKKLQSCYCCHKYFKIVERAKSPPKSIVVAVPTSAPSSCSQLKREAEEVIALMTPEDFSEKPGA